MKAWSQMSQIIHFIVQLDQIIIFQLQDCFDGFLTSTAKKVSIRIINYFLIRESQSKNMLKGTTQYLKKSPRVEGKQLEVNTVHATVFILHIYFGLENECVAVFNFLPPGESMNCIVRYCLCPVNTYTVQCAQRKVERQVKVFIKNLAIFFLFPSKRISLKIQLLVICNI